MKEMHSSKVNVVIAERVSVPSKIQTSKDAARHATDVRLERQTKSFVANRHEPATGTSSGIGRRIDTGHG
jgi:hypothetical protein